MIQSSPQLKQFGEHRDGLSEGGCSQAQFIVKSMGGKRNSLDHSGHARSTRGATPPASPMKEFGQRKNLKNQVYLHQEELLEDVCNSQKRVTQNNNRSFSSMILSATKNMLVYSNDDDEERISSEDEVLHFEREDSFSEDFGQLSDGTRELQLCL